MIFSILTQERERENKNLNLKLKKQLFNNNKINIIKLCKLCLVKIILKMNDDYEENEKVVFKL